LRADRLLPALAAALFFLAPAPAHALLCGALPLDPMSVTATPLSFGNYAGGSSSTASATITIACGIPLELLPNFTITLSAGNSGAASARYLNQAGNHLNYNIYTTSGYSTVWGDGNNGTIAVTYNGVLLQLGSTQLTAYGKAPAGQFVTPGMYTDTIMVTVTY
jgi:spore coat protein U-like protein